MNPKTEFKNEQRWTLFKKLPVARVGMVLLCLIAARSPAQTYTILHTFGTNDDGINPGVLVSSGTTLYGTASWGGNYGSGTVFSINSDGSGFSVLYSFSVVGANGTNVGGRDPSELVLSGNTLYGTATGGGNYGSGTVFSINSDGSGYSVLYGFPVQGLYGTNVDGADPGPLVLSGNTLYGTTSWGGTYGNGTVFAVNTDGSGFRVLHTNSGGSSPSGLVLSGNTLYGTAEYGGNYNFGTVFSINTDGSGFTVLHTFTGGSDGAEPMGGLILSGNTLYGTANYGGSSLNGTVFSINTDGSGFTNLYTFTATDPNTGTNSDGARPYASLVLSGNTLYGTAHSGGSSGVGTVFAVNTDGSGFTVLHSFTAGSDGAYPFAGLLLSGNTLYGTTSGGGSLGHGVLFALGYPPTIQVPPQTQTAYLGSTVDFAVDATRFPAPYYLWFANGTNLICCSTNSCLELTNLQFSQIGTYTVVVTNIFGAVTSAPVMLNVIPPVEHRPAPAIDLMGDVGTSLNVEYTDALGSLANWLPLDTVNLTNPPQYCVDVSEPLPPQRFYRAWQTGTPSVIPSLSLNSVPAIVLTGNIGDTLELDYINQYGPTNAWVMLATVTLTNTSQFYFDASSIGQPARLYRITPVP